MPAPEPADLSHYDRLCHRDEDVEKWLVSGEHHRELQAYLGEAEYERLAPLARAARGARRDRRRLVLILPGILGTQLGYENPKPWPANLLWPDPVDIISGRLAELALPDARPVVTLGAISYSYLALKLRLRAAGLDARIAAYDWRRSILDSAAELAKYIATFPRRDISLVAHSMGGLVARAALAQRPALPVSRIITLGTPHAGSVGPLQALRGVYPSVRRLAALDARHSAEELAAQVFTSYPSLYEMLPAPLLEPGNWPATGVQPRPALLAAAATFHERLCAADPRFTCIAGYGQRTALTATRSDSGFVYEVASLGDGTVTAAAAVLPGAENRYCACEHSTLPRSESVAAAIIATLTSTSGDVMLSRVLPAIAPQPVRVSDQELAATSTTKIDWRALSADERRRYLNQLNIAPRQYAAPDAGAAAAG